MLKKVIAWGHAGYEGRPGFVGTIKDHWRSWVLHLYEGVAILTVALALTELLIAVGWIAPIWLTIAPFVTVVIVTAFVFRQERADLDKGMPGLDTVMDILTLAGGAAFALTQPLWLAGAVTVAGLVGLWLVSK
jgi:hypothetical protein